MRITPLLGEAAMSALFVFSVVASIGVTPGLADESVPDFGGPTEAAQPAQPAEEPPVTVPSPPCHFGPITIRIRLEDLRVIQRNSSTPREAWNEILAREDDPEAQEILFELPAPDDGLGDGLVCPEE